MKPTRLQTTIYKMLIENTGSHMLDSGGAYGRGWQRNQKYKIQDFIKRPECILEVSKYVNFEKQVRYEMSVTIDLFHYLTGALSLDEYCDAFNNSDNFGTDWGSEEFYGVSTESEKWILSGFTPDGDSFNSYNHSANFSQVVQGRQLIHNETSEKYVLLQIHNGADVRGGYTDAKLFKVDVEYFLDESCAFEHVDWVGSEFINHEGQSVYGAELDQVAKKILGRKKRVELIGSIFEG